MFARFSIIMTLLGQMLALCTFATGVIAGQDRITITGVELVSVSISIEATARECQSVKP